MYTIGKVNDNLKNFSTYAREEYKQGDIFYADLGKGKGSEQEGVRPVVIIQNNMGNKYAPTLIVASITSKQTKKNLPTHVDISGFGLDKDSVILLEQLRTVDKERIGDKIGRINDIIIYKKIKQALNISIEENYLDNMNLTYHQKIIIENKLDEIYSLEKTMSIIKNNDLYEKLKIEREICLNGLENYCYNQGLNYNDFYINYHIRKENNIEYSKII